MKLFKVLVNGRSCHGGELEWSLPKGKMPGEWHHVSGRVEICRNGLHLTPTPEAWWKDGAKLYEAEAEGLVGDPNADTKVAAKSVRLLREVTPEEYAASRGIRALRGRIGLGAGYGYGDGAGYSSGAGYGYGDGSGYGYGSGYGDGDGDGDGSGYGYGSGYGDGDGDGSGYGSGAGYGYGSGYGYGYEEDIVT